MADHDPASQLRERVRQHYAATATAVTGAGGASCREGCGCGPVDVTEPALGAVLYSEAERQLLPADAVAGSLGCGNPLAVADLREAQTVLDLGCGGVIDVLLSARRVGPTGTAYGLDMTEEMLTLARRNAEQAGASNVEFLNGHIEAIPLPPGAVDVVISNCVINCPPTNPRSSPRCTGCSSRAGAWASPTSSPRTTSPPPTAPTTSAASPAPCPSASTATAWPQPGSPAP